MIAGGINASALRHRLKTLDELEVFMSHEEPNFFLLAEFVYSNCKGRKRNRWGYSRVVSDTRNILRGFDFATSLGRSYFREESFLSLDDIARIYEAVKNRHAAIFYLLLATSGMGMREIMELRVRDFDNSTNTIRETTVLQGFVANKLSLYIERNIGLGATQDSFLIGNLNMRTGLSFETSAIARVDSHSGTYARSIRRSKIETGIDPFDHVKSMKQGKKYPPGSIVRYCHRPGRREKW